MVDHLGAEPQVDAVGGVGEQEGAQGADHPLHQGHHHQRHPEDLQRVEAALGDHLVDDHLDQEGIGEAEELHHEGGQQHLQQHAAVALQGGPEPARAEFLVWCVGAALKQQELQTFGIGLGNLRRLELHPAISGGGQPQPRSIAGGHHREAALPGNQAGGDQPGGGAGRDLRAGHQQAEHGGNLAAELQVGFEAAAQLVAQHLVDGVAPVGQFEDLAQHLEAGQGFFEGAPGPHQLQPPRWVAGAEIQAGGLAGATGGVARSVGGLRRGGEVAACADDDRALLHLRVGGSLCHGQQPQGQRRSRPWQGGAGIEAAADRQARHIGAGQHPVFIGCQSRRPGPGGGVHGPHGATQALQPPLPAVRIEARGSGVGTVPQLQQGMEFSGPHLIGAPAPQPRFALEELQHHPIRDARRLQGCGGAHRLAALGPQ